MKLKDIITIIKYHGIVNGIKRLKDEFFEIIIFDLFHNVNTRMLKLENMYNINSFKVGEHKWYQPTYYTPLKKIAVFLNKILYLQQNLIIIDLGTGYGKPLIILNKFLKKNNYLIGVELDKSFQNVFINNLRKKNKKIIFINQKVEDVGYKALIKEIELKDFTIIVHNKNSFSKKITNDNLNIWRNLSKNIDKKIYYIYSNPEFEEIFYEDIIFKTKGWHKNFNINLYKL